MAPLTPEQTRRRDRVEVLIRAMSPGLTLVLNAGERLSKLIAPEDHEYYPPRAATIEPPPPPTREGDDESNDR